MKPTAKQRQGGIGTEETRRACTLGFVNAEDNMERDNTELGDWVHTKANAIIVAPRCTGRELVREQCRLQLWRGSISRLPPRGTELASEWL
ncbi:GL12344 [Drosophila persimilis]|uniref:GL12344 n=1 Tax=Drosophila persimilis TaxID=7234 RepID=B4GM88_DROPE|nr:GL12344 [Drosophila persimilis]